jgi:purine-cytosine permease-like protein
LNIIVGGGFFVVNLVVVGQILSAVSDYTMSLIVGIVIIAVVSFLLSVFGYRIIHTYEKYSWIVTFILLLVLTGQVAPHVDINATSPDASPRGVALAGSFLSIVAIMFSNASGWCSIAGDYYVHYPANTSRVKIFALTWAGVTIPVCFSIILGALLGNVAVTAAVEPYADAYENHGLGGLIYSVYHPNAFSKFCLIILTFSVLGNNIAINYSSGLSLQLLGHYFHAIPRFIWSFIFALVVAVIAIAGREHLSTIVSNFVSLLGYWTVSFTVILLVEDAIFRRKSGYSLFAWDRPSELPWGVAAVTALLAGYLAGGVPGMAQTWYIGPIALKFGPYGGDVGVYMSFAITAVVYPPLRALEKHLTGR